MTNATKFGRNGLGTSVASIGDPDFDVYVVAEIGVNHEGSLQQAKRLIDLAVEGGAHAAKFQTYKAEKLAVQASPAYWDTTKEPTESQFRLFKKYDAFGPAEYIELKGHCDKRGIDFLSTPFDIEAVDLLDGLMPFFKIASADITNLPLLRRVAACGKAVVLSTGASNFWEIDQAISELQAHGASSVALLHCMLNYPTAYSDAGISMIPMLKRMHPNLVIGYSDHTLPEPDMMTLTLSVGLGAQIIEKHFTHDKSLPGNDHYHAMDVDDLKVFIRNIGRLRTVTGPVDSTARTKETSARLNARRSIVAARDIASGETITDSHLTCKRPAFGVSPLFWDSVVGKRASRNIVADEIVHWRDIDAS